MILASSRTANLIPGLMNVDGTLSTARESARVPSETEQGIEESLPHCSNRLGLGLGRGAAEGRANIQDF